MGSDVNIQSSNQTKNQGLIAFTGGGSAGHVTPNIALIERWQSEGGSAIYFGRRDSVEEDLIAQVDNVLFLSVPSERLRRYFHWGNFIMPLIVLFGLLKATFLLWRFRPQVLFSKGGFVALPVVIGAWINRIPVIIHESDGSLGLANRLSLPFTRLVCLGQSRARKGIKHKNIQVTGSPLRQDFFQADPLRAHQRLGLRGARPLLVVFGGSQGAKRINEALWGALERLLDRYEICHIAGPNHLAEDYSTRYREQGYHQLEYLSEGFADLLIAAHWVIGRAGANAIAELVALKRPALLVPLSSVSSRGDQALNAEEFVLNGGGRWVDDEAFSSDRLIEEVSLMEENYSSYVSSLEILAQKEGTSQIIQLIRSLSEE